MLLCFHLEEAGATLRRRAKFTLTIEKPLPPAQQSGVCRARARFILTELEVPSMNDRHLHCTGTARSSRRSPQLSPDGTHVFIHT